MAYYNYKRVMHRDDFLAEAEVYAAECRAEGIEYEGGCDYDGDGWVVAERLLDKKDAEIAALKAKIQRREEGGKPEGEWILADDGEWVWDGPSGTSGKEED